MIIEKLKEQEEIFNDSKEPTKRKLRKRINTLELENETLKNIIKNELYKTFMKKLNDSEADKRYKEENIRLRKQIKVLKQIIKEERWFKMTNEEIKNKILELEAKLEENEFSETIREEARKAAKALRAVRDEFLKAGLPEDWVDKLLLKSINGGE